MRFGTNQVKHSQENSAKSANTNEPSVVENEFVSDAFQTSDKDLDEVKAGMKLLGIDSMASQSTQNGKVTR